MQLSNLSTEVEAELDNVSATSQKAKNLEKKLKVAYPSDQTIQNEE